MRTGRIHKGRKNPARRTRTFADATGTIFGSLAGTSTVTSYIESVAGIAAGARTGLSNVFVAALFVLAMFCSPLATAIPGYATAPALISGGCIDDPVHLSDRLGGFSVKPCRPLLRCWPRP